MEKEEHIILVALVSVTIILIAAKIIVFFMSFNKITRYITGEMRRAYDDNEYRYWRRELRCHYLCLIPFVNDRNVMRLYHRLYHKPKHENKPDRSDGLYHVLAPSIIGIFLCTVCLCGASWAWFTSTQTSSVANIQTTTYIATVLAKQGDTDITVIKREGISEIALESENKYTIMINAGGNAKSGYCKVELGETVYYTPQIKPNNVFTFKVKADSNGVLKITPQWGTCSVTENIMAPEATIELGTNPTTENTGASSNTVISTTPNTQATTQPTGNSITTVDSGVEKTTASYDTFPVTVSTEPLNESVCTDSKETTKTDSANE